MMGIVNNIVNAKLGSTQVQKIILNSTIIWENNDNSDYILTANYNDLNMYFSSTSFVLLEPYIYSASYNDGNLLNLSSSLQEII